MLPAPSSRRPRGATGLQKLLLIGFFLAMCLGAVGTGAASAQQPAPAEQAPTQTLPPAPDPTAVEPGEAEPGVTQPGETEPPGEVTTAESINVRMIDDQREPVAGVDVTVEQDGNEVGAGTTDDTGVVQIGVPAPGSYDILVDVETLPDGLSLANPDRNPAATTVNPTQTRQFIIRAVSGDAPTAPAATSGRWAQAPQLFVQGVRFGLILALAAIGLSIIFGTTGLTNFAHGEFLTFGAMITFSINVAGVPFLLAVPLALLICGIAGYLNDAVLWKPLRRRGTGLIAMMIVSIGLGLFVRYALAFWYGGSTMFYREYAGQAGIALGPVSLRPIDLISIGLSIAVLIAVSLALLKTRIGKATRAVADNPALAAASGIDVDKVVRTVWVVGAMLAGLSGILLAMGQGANYLMGFQILLLVFAAVVLGGLGTAFGALLGSVIVGVLIELSTLFLPTELKYVGALIFMIVILLIRPQGILGRRERIG